MNIEREKWVTNSYGITVESEELPKDQYALLESVTRGELVNSNCDVYPIEWDYIKYAWRESYRENTHVLDKNHDPLFSD